MEEISEEKIRHISEKIAREYKPEKIILFGSYAWGKPGPDSDVDLFIVKKSKKRRIDRQRELQMRLLGNKFPPLDLLVYTPEELRRRIDIGDFFIRDIMGKGRILYGK